MHAIDFHIFGGDLQFVEILLDPKEAVISEAGALMYMSENIKLDTVLGGAGKSKGVFENLFSAGKRLVAGESLFLSSFTNTAASGQRKVAFAAPYPGKIIALDLRLYGTVLCQKGSFLCSTQDINVEIAFTRRLRSGLFGGEGFILQKLLGEGLAFVHAGGATQSLHLAEGETLRVDTGCVVAFQATVNYDVEFVGNVKSMLFSGEGLHLAKLTGPGLVIIQSLPFSRLSQRIYQAAPSGGGRQRIGE